MILLLTSANAPLITVHVTTSWQPAIAYMCTLSTALRMGAAEKLPAPRQRYACCAASRHAYVLHLTRSAFLQRQACTSVSKSAVGHMLHRESSVLAVRDHLTEIIPRSFLRLQSSFSPSPGPWGSRPLLQLMAQELLIMLLHQLRLWPSAHRPAHLRAHDHWVPATTGPTVRLAFTVIP